MEIEKIFLLPMQRVVSRRLWRGPRGGARGLLLPVSRFSEAPDPRRTPYDPKLPDVLPFDRWIKDIGPTLQPPVANKMIFDEGFLKVMVVGGPNERKDYHLQSGEEFFWQIKGTLKLHVVLKNRFRTITVPEGHCFLLPARVPHSPRRSDGSIGIVVERGHEHEPEEMDGLQWYASEEGEGRAVGSISPESDEGDGDRGILYEEYFKCYDLGKELGPVIGRFQEFMKSRPQNSEGVTVENPPIRPDHFTGLGHILPFDPYIDECLREARGTTGGEGKEGKAAASFRSFQLFMGREKSVSLVTGEGELATHAPKPQPGEIMRSKGESTSPTKSIAATFPTDEVLLWQVRGAAEVVTQKRRFQLGHLDMALIAPNEKPVRVLNQDLENENDSSNTSGASATLVVQNMKQFIK